MKKAKDILTLLIISWGIFLGFNTHAHDRVETSREAIEHIYDYDLQQSTATQKATLHIYDNLVNKNFQRATRLETYQQLIWQTDALPHLYDDAVLFAFTQKIFAPKSAFETAQSGGKHSGFLKQHQNLSQRELSKSQRRLQRRIDQHESLIKDPKKAMKDQGKGDWDFLDPRQQKNLIEKKWPSDIQRQKEQLNIVEGILGG